MQDMIVVLEEGNHPVPYCPKCDMFSPLEALNRSHMDTEICTKGADRKHRRQMEWEEKSSTAVAFQAYGRPTAGICRR